MKGLENKDTVEGGRRNKIDGGSRTGGYLQGQEAGGEVGYPKGLTAEGSCAAVCRDYSPCFQIKSGGY
jgi:hypothetical protein